MKNDDEISDRKKKWQRWTTVMSYSLIIWIISVAALIITDCKSSLALVIFFDKHRGFLDRICLSAVSFRKGTLDLTCFCSISDLL